MNLEYIVEEIEEAGGSEAKRIRARLACPRCRKRKIKCKYELIETACEACFQAGVAEECEYIRAGAKPFEVRHGVLQERVTATPTGNRQFIEGKEISTDANRGPDAGPAYQESMHANGQLHEQQAANDFSAQTWPWAQSMTGYVSLYSSDNAPPAPGNANGTGAASYATIFGESVRQPLQSGYVNPYSDGSVQLAPLVADDQQSSLNNAAPEEWARHPFSDGYTSPYDSVNMQLAPLIMNGQPQEQQTPDHVYTWQQWPNGVVRYTRSQPSGNVQGIRPVTHDSLREQPPLNSNFEQWAWQHYPHGYMSSQSGSGLQAAPTPVSNNSGYELAPLLFPRGSQEGAMPDEHPEGESSR